MRVSREFQGLSDYLRDLYALQNLECFTHAALAGLRRLIPADLVLYGEIGGTGSPARFRAPAGDAAPALLAHWARSFPAHPLYRHFRQTGDERARRTGDALTPAERRAHAGDIALFGRGDELAFLFPTAGRNAIVILLHRARGAFTPAERDQLELLRPHLQQARANAVALSGLRRGIDDLVERLQGPDRTVVVLSARGRITHWSEQARDWIARYCKTVFPRPAARLPECFDRWVRDQLRHQARPLLAARPGDPLIVPAEGRELWARLIPDGSHNRQILLLEERCTAAPGHALDGLGLTARERDVLSWVAKGKTNGDIGLILAVSPRTVQKHLENIYRKLGVETRTMASARLYAALGALPPVRPAPLSH